MVGVGVLDGAWVVNGVAVVGAAVVAAYKKIRPLDACCAAAVSHKCCVRTFMSNLHVGHLPRSSHALYACMSQDTSKPRDTCCCGGGHGSAWRCLGCEWCGCGWCCSGCCAQETSTIGCMLRSCCLTGVLRLDFHERAAHRAPHDVITRACLRIQACLKVPVAVVVGVGVLGCLGCEWCGCSGCKQYSMTH